MFKILMILLNNSIANKLLVCLVSVVYKDYWMVTIFVKNECCFFT